MILTLEMKKLKRTGFLPAIFLGSLFACAFPLANTALCSRSCLPRKFS